MKALNFVKTLVLAALAFAGTLTAQAKDYKVDCAGLRVSFGESTTVGGVKIVCGQISQIQGSARACNWVGYDGGDSYTISLENGGTITHIEITGSIDTARGGTGWTIADPGYVWTGSATSVKTGENFQNVTQLVVTEVDPPTPIAFRVNAPEHATVAVYTNAVDAANLVTGDTVWSNETAYVVYTADEDYSFEFGRAVITNVLNTTVDPAVDTTRLPKTMLTWADEREVAVDTRARIVVGDPSEVLPLAYSTNFWGGVEGGAAMAVGVFDSALEQVAIENSVGNGYMNWQPTAGDYDTYAVIAQVVDENLDPIRAVTNYIYYTAPHPVDPTDPLAAYRVVQIAVVSNDCAEAIAAIDAVEALTEAEKLSYTDRCRSVKTVANLAIISAATREAIDAAVVAAKESFAKIVAEAERPPVVKPVPFSFGAAELTVVEGESLEVVVNGGSVSNTAAVTLSLVAGTYTRTPAVYLDGAKTRFPLTLNWTKGDVEPKTVTLVTTATRSVEKDRFFTLQLGSSVGCAEGTPVVCTVTVEDQTLPVADTTPYVRALAWPANGGKVTGSGTLAKATSTRTLAATANKWATFVGWFAAKTNAVEEIDLADGFVTAERKLKVSQSEAGTYYAYFTDVTPVASVTEPDASAAGVRGVTAWDGESGTYATMVGVKFALPAAFAAEEGSNGRLTVTKLPAGLAYSAKTGLISGVPTKAGTYAAQFVAANVAGKQTVTYTFEVAALPTVAAGSFYGAIRDDAERAGVGSVSFTAGKTGALSAKVVRRLSGTRSFSVKGYDYLDAATLGVAMTNAYGEVFEATLVTTNGWFETELVGAAFGGAKKGTLAWNGEDDGVFAASRNAFATSDGDAEAKEILARYRGTYTGKLYATNGVDEVGTVVCRVNAQGRVYVTAKLAATQDGAKRVAAKTVSGTVAGGFVYDLELKQGGTFLALRSGTTLWSADLLLDSEEGDAEGFARLIRPNAEDKTAVVDEDELVQ